VACHQGKHFGAGWAFSAGVARCEVCSCFFVDGRCHFVDSKPSDDIAANFQERLEVLTISVRFSMFRSDFAVRRVVVYLDNTAAEVYFSLPSSSGQGSLIGARCLCVMVPSRPARRELMTKAS
jgi:hypothetical protein